MTKSYITIHRDRVDKIAKRHYGTEYNGNTEAIFDANPNLASYGEILPIGITLTLPDRPQGPPKIAVVRLWD